MLFRDINPSLERIYIVTCYLTEHYNFTDISFVK